MRLPGVELRLVLVADDLVFDLVAGISSRFGAFSEQHRFAHREHRARCVSHNPLGGAADFPSRVMGESARRHDDQVGVQLFRGSGNLLERAAALDHNFTSQSGSNMPAAQDMQSLPRVPHHTLVGVLPSHRSVAEIVDVEYRLHDVDQHDGRRVATGQLHRRLQGARGFLGKVDRHEDLFRRCGPGRQGYGASGGQARFRARSGRLFSGDTGKSIALGLLRLRSTPSPPREKRVHTVISVSF